jgi:hypothetical protein
MRPGVLLIVSLFSWYLAAILMFWYCLWEQKPKEPRVTEVSFALKEGQTIVGVGETSQGMDFYIGDYVRDEKYYDL